MFNLLEMEVIRQIDIEEVGHWNCHNSNLDGMAAKSAAVPLRDPKLTFVSIGQDPCELSPRGATVTDRARSGDIARRLGRVDR